MRSYEELSRKRALTVDGMCPAVKVDALLHVHEARPDPHDGLRVDEVHHAPIQVKLPHTAFETLCNLPIWRKNNGDEKMKGEMELCNLLNKTNKRFKPISFTLIMVQIMIWCITFLGDVRLSFHVSFCVYGNLVGGYCSYGYGRVMLCERYSNIIRSGWKFYPMVHHIFTR